MVITTKCQDAGGLLEDYHSRGLAEDYHKTRLQYREGIITTV